MLVSGKEFFPFGPGGIHANPPIVYPGGGCLKPPLTQPKIFWPNFSDNHHHLLSQIIQALDVVYSYIYTRGYYARARGSKNHFLRGGL